MRSANRSNIKDYTGALAEFSSAKIGRSGGDLAGLIRDREIVEAIRLAHEHLPLFQPAALELKLNHAAESPFALDRTAPYLFFASAIRSPELCSSPIIPTDGDLNLNNVGFHLREDGARGLGPSDFDDAIIAPSGFDAARCGTSLLLAGKELKLEPDERRKALKLFLERFVEHIERCASDERHGQPGRTEALSEMSVQRFIDKQKSPSAREFLAKWTRRGELIHTNEVFPVTDAVAAEVAAQLRGFVREELAEDLKVHDVGFRMSGRSSLGRARYVALCTYGSDTLIMESKEAAQPALTLFGRPCPGSQADRVCQFARHFNPESAEYLGSAIIDSRDSFIRLITPQTKKFELEHGSASDMRQALRVLGVVAARMQLRSGEAEALAGWYGTAHNIKVLFDFCLDGYERMKDAHKALVKELHR